VLDKCGTLTTSPDSRKSVNGRLETLAALARGRVCGMLLDAQ
jgi:hypothetical protein